MGMDVFCLRFYPFDAALGTIPYASAKKFYFFWKIKDGTPEKGVGFRSQKKEVSPLRR